MCEIIDYDYNKIKRDLNKYVGVKEKKVNIKKVTRLFGEKHFTTPLSEGLERTVNYYISNI